MLTHMSINIILEPFIFTEHVAQLNKIDEELKRILSVKMDILKQLQVNKHFNVHIYQTDTCITIQEQCESRPESPLQSSWVSVLH